MATITLPGSRRRGAVASVRPPRACISSLDSGGGEEAVEGGSNGIEGEGGRDRRKARREKGRILCMPYNVDLRLGEPSTEETVGPEDT